MNVRKMNSSHRFSDVNCSEDTHIMIIYCHDQRIIVTSSSHACR